MELVVGGRRPRTLLVGRVHALTTSRTTTTSGAAASRPTCGCSRSSASRGSSPACRGSRSCASATTSAPRSPASIRPPSPSSTRPTSTACSATPASCATAARSARRSTTPQRALEMIDEYGSLAAYFWPHATFDDARAGRDPGADRRRRRRCRRSSSGAVGRSSARPRSMRSCRRWGSSTIISTDAGCATGPRRSRRAAARLGRDRAYEPSARTAGARARWRCRRRRRAASRSSPPTAAACRRRSTRRPRHAPVGSRRAATILDARADHIDDDHDIDARRRPRRPRARRRTTHAAARADHDVVRAGRAHRRLDVGAAVRADRRRRRRADDGRSATATSACRRRVPRQRRRAGDRRAASTATPTRSRSPRACATTATTAAGC